MKCWLHGNVIIVKSAQFGRWERYACGVDDQYVCGGGSYFHALQRRCDGKRSCSVYVSRDLVDPDPCPGASKYLNVTYECGRGKEYDDACIRHIHMLSTYSFHYCSGMPYIRFYTCCNLFSSKCLASVVLILKRNLTLIHCCRNFIFSISTPVACNIVSSLLTSRDDGMHLSINFVLILHTALMALG